MNNTVIRTNIVLDKDLIEELSQITNIKTRRELVDHALRELKRHKEQRKY